MDLVFRYFVRLSFKGTEYHGWQTQGNAVSVQQTLCEKFTIFLKEKIAITGAGRTDTGVHARNYIAHFDSVKNEIDSDDFVFRINRFLPDDIVIHEIVKVPADAHSRFDAVSRTYKYFLNRVKDPFRKDISYYYSGPLDINAMNMAADILSEYNDFSSFSKAGSDTKNNLCSIKEANWTDEGDMFVFTITADRFLRNMVRAITGSLLEVGSKKIEPENIRTIVKSKNRSDAGTSVPAHGLFLVKIEYPETIVKFRYSSG
ncbi:MAG: tRNA pseudouridine(38-40) synthase TruA [Bacteroidetes bacterium]|nr:tRNA pseudouridine(38-40) synthase TruA [Bacteroidota bacterium]